MNLDPLTRLIQPWDVAISEKAAEALVKGKKAASTALANVKKNEKKLQGKVAGFGAGYFSAGWWATRRADEKTTGKTASFELGKSMKIDGTKTGLIVGAVGAMGWLGDPLYDEAAYGAGVGIMAADRAITRYEERLAEPKGT